mmetsp:Transcript_19010/g.36653  ORF Transcript_19010/g.36653 Transcript_19010/m.36653 type:complete len:253 (-) Transcript_19010:328-1086(-)|eukprot:CAMPEP_0114250158 /NCGR_PEP_ID=MMETSP0058-20121206/14547_1 /TAXON_ID=36894 /ORGANISM="Pyramimonas parkeae, CCMP726" /LENGTH=252 /DNA_ID=CAMNT_0001363793 /DNA_START=67 /DNA_END=825 /DNA_ORIENTATION=+
MLEVIGAGFGRTGTDSLRAALNQLGYPCYHMFVAAERKDFERWVSADEQLRLHDDMSQMREILGDFKATVDFPASVFYKELLRDNPGAKVVLTVRDSESWYKSAINTIWHPWAYEWSPLILSTPPGRQMKNLRDVYVARILKKSVHEVKAAGGPVEIRDKSRMVQCFDEHIKEVKAHVPPGDLLVFQVKDGWEPLCAFLGKPVPSTPFPNVNNVNDFWRQVKVVNTVVGIFYSVLVGIFAVAVHFMAIYMSK